MRRRILITPFSDELLNPNSYNFTLGSTMATYDRDVLDARKLNSVTEFGIPDQGVVLQPGKLYLGHTEEKMGSDFFVPTFAARSSIARLGLFINLSASLGDIGYYGQWTLQLVPTQPIRIFWGMRIGQMMWWRATGLIDLYQGKYQGSCGPHASLIHRG